MIKQLISWGYTQEVDFFTKPLQGKLFQHLQDFVLAHRPISELHVPSISQNGSSQRSILEQ